MPGALNRWAFDGFLFNQPGVRVREMTGLLGLPPLRGSDFLTPGVPGQLFVPKIHDSRRLALEILVSDMEAAAASTYLDILAALFAQRTQSPLVHFHADGTIRTAQAECVSWTIKDADAVGALYIGVADFLLADPYFYTPAITSTVAIGGSPTAITVLNPGTVRGPGPQGTLVLDFLGPIVNPRLTNSTNGSYVECDVSVASGKHLLIDCAALTALNDGVNAIGSIVHSGALQFLVLDPGANVCAVTSVTPGGALTVTFTPAYI